MTISSTTRKAGPFAGNGVSTVFPFGFKVFAKTDIKVLRAASDGVATTLSIDSDYSVTLNSNQDTNPGGTITYPVNGAALPTGYVLVALGNLADLQPTDITNSGGFYPQVIEDMVDRSTIQIQQVAETVGRALVVTEIEATSPVLPSASERAGSLLGFDALGDIEMFPITASVGAGDLRVDTFVSGVDFTPGVTTLLMLSRSPGAVANVQLHFDIAFQGPENIASLAGPALTLSAPIPVGVGKVYVTTGTTLSLNLTTPSMIQPGSGGFFSDFSPQPVVWKFADRVRIGHAKALNGDLQYLGSPTYQIPHFGWAERESSNHTVSPGRMAVTGVTQQSLVQPVVMATFTGSISGSLLTVTAVASGPLQTFQVLNGAGIPGGIYIASFGTGTGGIGTYNLNVPVGTVSSGTITVHYLPNGIGVSGFGLNDDTVYGSFAWGAYAECFRVQGAGAVYAMELDVGEGSTGGTLNNPYVIGGSASVGILMNSGGSAGPYVAPASAALIIGSNLGTFNAGIIFNNNALASDGGKYHAIQMAEHHRIEWWKPSGTGGAFIQSDVTSGAEKNISFVDGGIFMGDANNNAAFVFDMSTGSANGLQFSATAAGVGFSNIIAVGADTNLDITLLPKGSGLVKFGVLSAGVLSPTGYISIKDTGGTIRRLLVG